MYYRLLRPDFLKAGRKRKRDEKDERDPKEFFFLSSAGKPIHNTSNDLHRLHTRYNLKAVTSQMVRRVYETATKEQPHGTKTMVADYLSLSNATAEKHYRYRTSEHTVMAVDVVKNIGLGQR